MTAPTAAENFCVKEEVAQSWLTGHRTTYPGYYAWAEEFGAIAAARGYAISPVSGLWRWVDSLRLLIGLPGVEPGRIWGFI